MSAEIGSVDATIEELHILHNERHEKFARLVLAVPGGKVTLSVPIPEGAHRSFGEHSGKAVEIVVRERKL